MFRFPKSRIPDSMSKVYPDFGFELPRLPESGWRNIEILCVTPRSNQKLTNRS